MTDVVIVAATRTPVGSFNGVLSAVPSFTLGEVVIRELLKRSKVDAKEIDEVILGQILTAGCGQNPARLAAVNAGLPIESTAFGINQLCGSGLRAVALGLQAIRNGDADIIIAGGQESMSLAPHLIHLRNGVKMGNAEMHDHMLRDALWEGFSKLGYHMGNTAENVAKK